MDADGVTLDYELKDELARLCLPAADRDANRKLAWVNSICLLFLVIGLIGVKPATGEIKPVPPVEEIVPVILEPAPPAPETIKPDTSQQERTEEEKQEAAQVVVVTPESPKINFAVPTIGTLVVPNAVAVAPPLTPMQPGMIVRERPASPSAVGNTGVGGERPQPPYPKLALQEGQQGTVRLLMAADESGNIVSVEVKGSSGYPLLDRGTIDFIKRHWRLPAGAGTHLFESSIIYRLQVE